MNSGPQTLSSGSCTRKRQPREEPASLLRLGHRRPRPGTNTSTITNDTRYVAASITRTGAGPKMPIRTPASGGPSSIVVLCAARVSAVACEIVDSSSPSSSGKITRCAAKYGAVKRAQQEREEQAAARRTDARSSAAPGRGASVARENASATSMSGAHRDAAAASPEATPRVPARSPRLRARTSSASASPS